MKGSSRAVVPVVVIVMLLMVILSYTDARPLRKETTRNRGKEALVIGMSNSKTTMMMKDQTTSASREDAVFSHESQLFSDKERLFCAACASNWSAKIYVQLMGVAESSGDDGEDEEGCGREHGNGEDEEECRMKRRMMAEAHLDYIYTQNHNHP
ncbi:hypothetical protein MLD38_019602 [Melastoma candidum]|uniref:Uncharacterized protein n=1 Tax=Melastoma candidum TaxID=119954 RepID=A0ACB9QWM7_9MYRT|nr:hypothetical protein MLD38_019602 [Melastoma candidum]